MHASSPEWKRTVGTAKLAGVVFHPRIIRDHRIGGRWRRCYEAVLPGESSVINPTIMGYTVYEAAVQALSKLMGNSPPPPDAATAQKSPAGGSPANTTEELT